jgi:hypothetical protein
MAKGGRCGLYTPEPGQERSVGKDMHGYDSNGISISSGSFATDMSRERS